VHRLLSSLVEMGYAEQVPETEKYRLTTKLFQVGSAVVNRTGITQAALPVMEMLQAKTGETINLAILDHGEVIYVQKVDSMEPVREDIRIGTRFPAHCTALGKALLAHQTKGELAAILQNLRLVQRTPNTITDARRLLDELASIRQQGYAVDNEELSIGLRCVAASIRNGNGKAVAALSIAGPSTRLSDDRIPPLAQLVKEGASIISGKLGYPPA